MAQRKRRRLIADAEDPLERVLGDSRGAERVIRFFERVLVHAKPPFAGRPFLLQDWQKNEIIRPIYNPMDERGRAGAFGGRSS